MKKVCLVIALLALIAMFGSSSSAAAQTTTTTTAKPKLNVAILIFDGVQIIDYTGPYEVFGQAGLRVFTVAASTAPITTSMGMKVTPDHTLAQAPPADILVIPGGDIRPAMDNPEVIAWIRERAAPALSGARASSAQPVGCRGRAALRPRGPRLPLGPCCPRSPVGPRCPRSPFGPGTPDSPRSPLAP